MYKSKISVLNFEKKNLTSSNIICVIREQNDLENLQFQKKINSSKAQTCIIMKVTN